VVKEEADDREVDMYSGRAFAALMIAVALEWVSSATSSSYSKIFDFNADSKSHNTLSSIEGFWRSSQQLERGAN